ncbi:MAG TPA: hypothetical protein VKX17_28760 [Planctomycetota bacterium]|nr:hypothetical protein [Planctomycetota bacterium]
MKSIFALCACLALAATFSWAEEPPKDQPKDANPNPNPVPNAQNNNDNAGGGGRARGGRGPGGGGGNWQQGGGGGAGGQGFGGGGPGGMGGAGGIGQIINGVLGGNNTVSSMAARMLGVDLDGLKKEANLDQLPLADSRRFVTKIPVGGVDNFNATGSGWKVEGVFKMTPDQTKAVESVRDEYTAEQRKLSKEIYDAELQLAQKVVDLRKKYEQKANDVLTGADKESKQQMDALSAEIQTKATDTVKGAADLYDLNDAAQGMQFITAMREKVNALFQNGKDRLTTLVPEGNRAKIQDLLKQADPVQNFIGGRGARIMQNNFGGDGTAVKPPAPPKGDEF